ncbi:MAG: hypothetical protein O9353_06865 [Bacteroidia bacterium]|jgi:hypothetical protein|nr:hypothetical protein [Bacteroidia bacterium]
MYQILAYIIYLGISLITVLVVGKNLHRNGKAFLFGECPDEALSNSTNNLLYIGYCLVNTGFAFFFLNASGTIVSFPQLLEFIATAEGIIFLSLGALHILNVIFAPRIISFFLAKKLQQHK